MSTLTIIDSPNRGTCHGKYTIESAREIYGDGDLRHIEIDKDCKGRITNPELERAIRDARGFSAVNVSWGTSIESRNAVIEALSERVFESNGGHSRTPAEQVMFEGGQVVYASGNEGHTSGTAHPGLFSIEVGAYNTNEEKIYSYSNRYNGLLVNYWANGRAPSGPVGTSFAAPRVAASLAVLIRNGFDIAEANTALTYTSLPLANPQSLGDFALINSDAIKNLKRSLPINNAIRIMAAYVVGLGRRPDASGWQYWTDQAENSDIKTTIEHFLKTARKNNDWMKQEVPLARRVQAHWHLLFGEEIPVKTWREWMVRFAWGRYGTPQGHERFKLDWQRFLKDFVDDAEYENKEPMFAELLFD